jgi:hypothetical protein
MIGAVDRTTRQEKEMKIKFATLPTVPETAIIERNGSFYAATKHGEKGPFTTAQAARECAYQILMSERFER